MEFSEKLGFLLIVVSLFFGHLIPTSIEFRWIIITLFFVWATNKKLDRIEEKYTLSKKKEKE